MMNEPQRILLDQLCQLRVTPPGQSLSFEARLARENGWDLSRAIQVDREYRRFLFLMLEAPHPVTPSDQVDQAWHLHLIYTESYWNDLCGEIAGRPLHHGPTAGGQIEQTKYHDWYEKTKESYREFFGEAPPMSIWPDSNIRFTEDIAYRRVNTIRNMLLPNPVYWLRRLLKVVLP